jgi:hypothetical protein
VPDWTEGEEIDALADLGHDDEDQDEVDGGKDEGADAKSEKHPFRHAGCRQEIVIGTDGGVPILCEASDSLKEPIEVEEWDEQETDRLAGAGPGVASGVQTSPSSVEIDVEDDQAEQDQEISDRANAENDHWQGGVFTSGIVDGGEACKSENNQDGASNKKASP